MWLLRPPGVYPPQADTELLVEALRLAAIPPGGRVLDVGCGAGALSVTAALCGAAEVVTFDLSRRAVWTTRFNAAVRRLPVRVGHGDALDRALGSSFDLVLANPPYVPGPRQPDGDGPDRAWEGGPDGRAVLDRLCALAPLLLNPGGILLLVHSSLCDEERTLHELRGGGLKASVVARRDEPFGPVMSRRAPWLVERGLIARGQRHEELVVIRADRPEPQ